MKHIIFQCLIFIILLSCKKEKEFPTLSFTSEQKQWLIYEVGQKLNFKNASGDSLNYTVIKVEKGYKPQYLNPQPNAPLLGNAEFYYTILASKSDSIFIYFYKEFGGSNLDNMKQTIRWNTFRGQFVELEAIEKGTPFITKTINSVKYFKVTQALPVGVIDYPFTRFNQAYYDQKSGFIEIIDTSSNLWLRL